MSPFFGTKPVEAVLFSPLEGHITFKGKPLTNTKLNLWIKWKDKKGQNYEYKTNNDGYFSIPKITDTFKPKFLARLVIAQEIKVTYLRNEYLIWTLSKTSYEENIELNGASRAIICELTDELQTFRYDHVLMGTKCRW